MKENYNNIFEDITSKLNYRPKVLLHSCCAPCSSHVVTLLKEYFDVTVLYYNPNIYPLEEYLKRKNEQIKLLEILNIPIMDIDYDKIKEIYGNDILSEIISNKEDIIKNLYYFYQLGFEDVEDIFERQVMIFICSNDEFINKINNLINKIGNNYIDEIENNIELLDELN